jgi:hypothetical protein
LQKGIKKISGLLPELEKYRYASDFITNQAFKVDDGVVGVVPALPIIGPVGGTAYRSTATRALYFWCAQRSDSFWSSRVN